MRDEKKYYIIFIDNCTKFCYIYLLRSKDEALKTFKYYNNEVKIQLNKKIKVIKSDKGGEYRTLFSEFCS
jgi:3-isopropylmalate dehydratase small subunit